MDKRKQSVEDSRDRSWPSGLEADSKSGYDLCGPWFIISTDERLVSSESVVLNSVLFTLTESMNASG